MKILILSRDPNYYATKRLVGEAQKQRHQTLVIDPLECDILLKPPFLKLASNNKDLSRFDFVIPRVGIVGIDYALLVVKQFELMGIPLLNSHAALCRAKNKFEALQILCRAGIPIPDSAMTRNPARLADMLKELGGFPSIIKLFRGSQGKGVIMAESFGSANSVLASVWALGLDAMLQKYIADTGGQDIRVFILGDKAIASMRRIPPKGEFRSNIHQGGKMKKVSISAEESQLAIKASKIMGLNNAGVDILRTKKGPLVLEVNSSPGFEGLETITGQNIAGQIIEYCLDLNRHAK